MPMKYGDISKIPRPFLDHENQEYWKFIREKKQLHFQRCKKCGALFNPPRPMCNKCHSFELEWVPASEKGKVYSFAIYRRMAHTAFLTPFNCVLVELEDGVRFLSNIIDCEPEEIYIGMPVKIVYEELAEDLVLVKFKRAD